MNNVFIPNTSSSSFILLLLSWIDNELVSWLVMNTPIKMPINPSCRRPATLFAKKRLKNYDQVEDLERELLQEDGG